VAQGAPVADGHPIRVIEVDGLTLKVVEVRESGGTA